MCSYCGFNIVNLQICESVEIVFMGRFQLDWLLDGFKCLKVVWKVIVVDMLFSLYVVDGKEKWEVIVNGEDGVFKGWEFELVGLLCVIKKVGIQNVVWFIVDVYYIVVYYFDLVRVQFSDFLLFWEFVFGLFNVGGFGFNKIDVIFGMQVVYQKVFIEVNVLFINGLQFFGQVDIDVWMCVMMVMLKDFVGDLFCSKMLVL